MMLNFIRREKLYVAMLLFILAVNVMSPGRTEKAQAEGRPNLSTMTFKEIGVTEERVREYFESEGPGAIFFKYSIAFAFFIFILSIALNLSFIFRGKKVDLKALPCKAPVSWGIPDLIKAGIIIIFASYIIGIGEGLVSKMFDLDLGLNQRMIIGTFFIDMSVAAVVLYFVIVKCRERLWTLGLGFESVFSNILTGITSYIFILPILFLTLFLSMWVLNLMGYSPPPQPVFEVFMEEKSGRMLLFLTLFVSMFGPVIEEMFFRGFMYSAIKKHLGFLGAAFLSASIFSILHTNIVGFLPIMALGVLLAYLYEKTGSLVAPMAVHILHNSIIVAFVFFIKELV